MNHDTRGARQLRGGMHEILTGFTALKTHVQQVWEPHRQHCARRALSQEKQIQFSYSQSRVLGNQPVMRTTMVCSMFFQLEISGQTVSSTLTKRHAETVALQMQMSKCTIVAQL